MVVGDCCEVNVRLEGVAWGHRMENGQARQDVARGMADKIKAGFG